MNFGMRNRQRILCIDAKNTIFPVTRLSVAISKSVQTEPLSFSFMPTTLIPMSICKVVYTKTMHFVCKILAGIHVTISAFIM
ncbi:hypothetical protein Hanom_Chr04g00314861 [Helianthus anomalus]